MGLSQFEQRLERFVEGAFAKAFRGELQPVELGKRLTREMDLHRTVAVSGLLAPNCFRVTLSIEDFDRFGGFVKVLASELVDAAREHARSEQYHFLGPVEVTVAPSRNLAKSNFTIDTSFVEGEELAPGWLILPDGRQVAIAEESLTIGRLPDCDVALSDSNASRHHAQLRRDGDTVYLVDLGSTNGTKVNGERVRERRLEHGDLITIGTTVLRYDSKPS